MTSRKNYKKKRKNKTKKLNPLKTIYKEWEFGRYPMISPLKYAAQRNIDNLNFPSNYPTKDPLRKIGIQELIKRISILLRKKNNQKKLYHQLGIRYNKNIYDKLIRLAANKKKLILIENFFVYLLKSSK